MQNNNGQHQGVQRLSTGRVRILAGVGGISIGLRQKWVKLAVRKPAYSPETCIQIRSGWKSTKIRLGFYAQPDGSEQHPDEDRQTLSEIGS